MILGNFVFFTFKTFFGTWKIPPNSPIPVRWSVLLGHWEAENSKQCIIMHTFYEKEAFSRNWLKPTYWHFIWLGVIIVCLGDTSKDGGAMDMKRESKGLTWGVGWVRVRMGIKAKPTYQNYLPTASSNLNAQQICKKKNKNGVLDCCLKEKSYSTNTCHVI